MSHDLTQSRVEAATMAICPAVRFLESTDSTNSVALEWAREGALDRSLVVADQQTAGRGRLGRSWFSKPGSSLLFSVVLRPSMPTQELGLINIAAAAALATALAEDDLDPRVKWPNDVLLEGKKVAGILGESEVVSGGAACVVLGVGVNVNTPAGDFPEEIRHTASSVMAVTHRLGDRLTLLSRFLRKFFALLESISSGTPMRVIDAYIPICETVGRRVRVQLGNMTMEANATGVDASGGLILDNGEVVRTGEVVHLR